MVERDADSQPPHILVLWDIDHTLIEMRGVGQAIYERVFPAVTGKPLRQLAEVAGRTELVIMHDTLQLHDIEPTEQMMRRLAAALVQAHDDARQELATTGRALPGAKETLAALAADLRVHQAVLSGNLRDVSRIKLEVFGLDSYLDLVSSAYGDDHTEPRSWSPSPSNAPPNKWRPGLTTSTPSLSGTPPKTWRQPSWLV
ncbi:MAG: HAD family hydrolase, partial [Pseudonocardiaceae bacterium]